MNHRERLITALNHQEPDRVPIDFGSTGITSIALNAYQDLRKHLDLPYQEKPFLTDHIQRLALVDEQILQMLDVDARMVQNLGERREPESWIEGNYSVIKDNWGSTLRMPLDGGLYYDWFRFPLENATVEDLDRYPWPSLYSEKELDAMTKRAEYLYHETDYALVGSLIFGGGLFEQPSRLMGMENFYISLLKNQRFAEALIDKLADIYIAVTEQCLERFGQYLQVVAYWDDLGSQNSLLLSPRLYRKLLKPRQKRLVDAIKAKTGAKVFIHSCGSIRRLIPDLIEVGFDIINPVQFSAEDMDPIELKREFGRDVVFWGGSVDAQSTLPFGTPDQVRDEARRSIDALAPGGGYVFSSIHNIQSFVPPENVITLFQTAREYGVY
ncbi:MAG: hypothetical protein JXA42_06380 [Anaerolineales bacterium]|nr:hypothetical protein [Anaerolineales bacterium]